MVAKLAAAVTRDPEAAEAFASVPLAAVLSGDAPRAEVDAALRAATELIRTRVGSRPSLLGRLGVSALSLLAAEGTGVEDATTVVFTDLSGFTSWCLRHGDAAAADLLAGLAERTGRIIDAEGGRVAKRLGDGLMVTFEDPAAACRAVVTLVGERYGGLPMRAGVHSGAVTRLDGDLIGTTVNTAARVGEVARPAEALATVAVRDAVLAAGGDPGVRFGRVRRRQAKGIPGGLRVVPVVPGR